MRRAAHASPSHLVWRCRSAWLTLSLTLTVTPPPMQELVAGGKTLESNQLEKIKNEEQVKEELAGLQAKLQAKADEGKWR